MAPGSPVPYGPSHPDHGGPNLRNVTAHVTPCHYIRRRKAVRKFLQSNIFTQVGSNHPNTNQYKGTFTRVGPENTGKNRLERSREQTPIGTASCTHQTTLLNKQTGVHRRANDDDGVRATHLERSGANDRRLDLDPIRGQAPGELKCLWHGAGKSAPPSTGLPLHPRALPFRYRRAVRYGERTRRDPHR